MKKIATAMITALGLVTGILLLAGCNDAQKMIEKLNLSSEQAKKARPILEDYVKNVDRVIADLEKQRPGMGGRPPQGGPPQGGGNFSGQNRPDPSQMKAEMSARKQEIENRFLILDARAAADLQDILSEAQIEYFKQLAVEYREEKMKSSMPRDGRNGPSGPPSGGDFGPPN